MKIIKKKKVIFLKKLVFYYTLIFSIVLFIIFSVVLVVYNYYSKSTRVLTEQIIVNESLKQLDSYMLHLENRAQLISTNPEIISYFSEFKSDKITKDYLDINILTYLEIYTIIKNINAGINSSWRISVYNEKGNFISTGTLVDKIQVKNQFKKDDINKIVKTFKNKKISYLIKSPEDDKWSSYYDSKYISFYKPIKNEYSDEILGLIEIQENISTLKNYLKIGQDNIFSINLYDDKNNILINSNKNNMIKVSSIKSVNYGFTIDLLESKENLSYKRNIFIIFLFLFLIVIIVIMSIIINKIANNLSKPVIELKNILLKVNSYKPLEIEKSNTTIDEISELQNAVEELLVNVNTAHEQEKIAIFHAIQAQMNPHFLYNTLSVISAIAIENENFKIVKLCENISNMLRYVSNYSEEVVTLNDELNHTISYLELMKERYDDMFLYDIEIKGEIEKIRVPKLVMQPIAENCFFHAFNDIEPPYKIKLIIKVINEKNYKIIVIDNGSGFSKSKQKEIMNKSNFISNNNIKNVPIGGIGILSSVERLKLFTGSNVYCKITDNNPRGSIVTIVVEKNITLTI